MKELNKKLYYFLGEHLWLWITLFSLMITYFVLSIQCMDNDGWFILANGRYILEHGIPYKNPFTWMKGLDVVLQQWAYSVVVYSIYQWFKVPGIFLFCCLLHVACMILFFKIAKLKQVDIKTALVLSSVMFLIGSSFLSIRPTFITVLLLLWQVYVLEQYRQDKKAWKLWQLILISLLEINFHAAIWPFHFVMLLPYLVPPIENIFVQFKPKDYSIKPFLIVIPMMAAAGFLNPYRIDGIKYVFLSYGKELKDAGVVELAAPSFQSSGLVFLLLLAVILCWIALHMEEKIDAPFFYILCGTAIMGTMHLRNLIYAYFGILLFLCEMVRQNKQTVKRMIYGNLVFAVFLGTIAFAWSGISGKVLDYKQDDDVYSPVKAIAYLDEHEEKDVKVFTEFNNGAYFEWSGYKCFVDPRPELYFKKLNHKADIFQEYQELITTTEPEKIDAFFDKYQCDYACVSKRSSLNLYFSMQHGWKPMINSKEYVLYQKK